MSRTIIALDFKDRETTLNFLDKFEDKLFVKIGMELFYKEGPEIVKEIKNRGHQIFLDLKVMDIPNTAKGAMTSLSSLGVDMTNVHCLGGSKMMMAAKEPLPEKTILLGVTILTSIDQETMNNELMIDGTVGDAALSLARTAKESGLGGVVCSPFEAKKIHEVLGKDFVTVCPGIRMNQSKGDQKRVATPSFAKEEGVDYIVVGREVTKSEDPVSSYRAIKEAFEGC